MAILGYTGGSDNPSVVNAQTEAALQAKRKAEREAALQALKDARYQEYLDLIGKVTQLDWDYNNDPERNKATVDRLKTLYGEFGVITPSLDKESFGVFGGMPGQYYSLLGLNRDGAPKTPEEGGGTGTSQPDLSDYMLVVGTPDNPGPGVVVRNPETGEFPPGYEQGGVDGPAGTYTDRLNYGTNSNTPNEGISGLSGSPVTTATTTATPSNNEGIQTLTNTYAPPTNIDQQAADQVMRAGQTNVAAQNLANQQAATYANMFTPRTTANTTTADTTDVGTGGDDATSGTDTGGTGGTTSTDGGATVTVGGTTNTGLNTQDLIDDYLQTQGVTINDINNPVIDYYNIGNPGSIPGVFDPFNINTFFTPMNTIDFSSLPTVTDPNAPLGFAPVGIASLDF